MAFCVVDFSKGKIVGTLEQYNQIAELNQARRGGGIKIKKCSISNKGQSRKVALQIKMTFSKIKMIFSNIKGKRSSILSSRVPVRAKKWCCTFTYLKFLAIFLHNSSLYFITFGNSSRKVQCI